MMAPRFYNDSWFKRRASRTIDAGRFSSQHMPISPLKNTASGVHVTECQCIPEPGISSTGSTMTRAIADLNVSKPCSRKEPVPRIDRIID
jgi:hypothetical protein